MELLNTKKAAEKLGVSERRVLALIYDSKIIATKVGRDYVIQASSLDGVKTYGKQGRPPKAKDAESADAVTTEAQPVEIAPAIESKPKRTKKAKAKKEKTSV